MNARAHRGRLVAVSLSVLVLVACAPVAAPAPAPAPAPGSPRGGAPSQGSACSTSVTSAEGKTQYFAMVDDGSGRPDAVTFDAATPAEKQADVAQIDATQGDVVAVEPDQVVTSEAFVNDPSNDPRFGGQWGVSAAGFPAAWSSAGTQGSGVRVAVLDTGVYAAHEDLGLAPAGAVLPGFDEIDGSTVDGTTDPGGHGTHTAGIVGARDNTVGGVGGAPDVQIIPVRVLNAQGSGFYSDVIDGINDARLSGAKVISMSLGGAPYSQSLQDTVTTAVNAGIVVVAAAGNTGTCDVLYPAALTGVISVAATQQSGLGLASFSGRGSWVDIAAPGDLIDSTLNGTSSSYGQLSGTSMATPFVAAAAALLIANCPGISPATVESRLVSTVSPQISGIRAGSGELRADRAITAGC